MQNQFKLTLSGLFILLLVVIIGIQTNAQGPTDLKFNEVLVLNNSSNVDDFGEHSAWFEFFNTAYNTVNIGGCYLTDDLNNPTKYWIPTGDPGTKVPARCYIIFYADNKPSRGIFHINFDLKNAKTIALFSSNGKSMIDKIDLPQLQFVDKSFGRISPDSNEWGILEKITPAANNDTSQHLTSGEQFEKMDPYGLGMTMIAMLVVFLALAVLYLIYKSMGNLFIRISKKGSAISPTSTTSSVSGMSGEVNAAIAMALYLYQSEMHDRENTVLTIKKVSKIYSPWSSKIYTLRKLPR
jgi:hypothetical protein